MLHFLGYSIQDDQARQAFIEKLGPYLLTKRAEKERECVELINKINKITKPPLYSDLRFYLPLLNEAPLPEISNDRKKAEVALDNSIYLLQEILEFSELESLASDTCGVSEIFLGMIQAPSKMKPSGKRSNRSVIVPNFTKLLRK